MFFDVFERSLLNMLNLFSILLFFKCNLLAKFGKFSAAITPAFSATWSFKKQSYMLSWCSNSQETYIIINVENKFVLHNIFLDFWRIVWHKTGVIASENSALPSQK